ncbi:MAG: RCKP-type rubredoxin-like domain-containing protein [Acidobacteriota bacterium]
MSIWSCSACGHQKDARCKPKKCPECGAINSFLKKEEKKQGAKKSGKKC